MSPTSPSSRRPESRSRRQAHSESCHSSNLPFRYVLFTRSYAFVLEKDLRFRSRLGPSRGGRGIPAEDPSDRQAPAPSADRRRRARFLPLKIRARGFLSPSPLGTCGGPDCFARPSDFRREGADASAPRTSGSRLHVDVALPLPIAGVGVSER